MAAPHVASERARLCRTGIGRPAPLSPGCEPAASVAPFVFDRTMNGAIFRQYVRQLLAPTLAPGDVVVLDNLAAHKVAGVCHLIEARGARLLFLPAYSPDLNPIELMFDKLKSLLRSASARTIDRLWSDLGTCLEHFSADECSRYVRHCGYGQTG